MELPPDIALLLSRLRAGLVAHGDLRAYAARRVMKRGVRKLSSLGPRRPVMGK
jgi:hypothetical protein